MLVQVRSKLASSFWPSRTPSLVKSIQEVRMSVVPTGNDGGIVTKPSPRSVSDTTARFTEMLAAKG